MKILAIETSGLLGSVALLEESGGGLRLLEERPTPVEQRTARSLLPTLQQLLAAHRWRPADVQLVAVTTGPGSFTGLRIGVVAAKTFAYAVGAELVGVHTLAALAEPIEPGPSRLWTILDAQRQEFFVASFDANQRIAQDSTPTTEILPIEKWLGQLVAGDQVAGPPLAKIESRLPQGVISASPDQWHPSAAAVGRLAHAQYQRGERTDPLELVPNYYRKSAAEEKAATAKS